MTFKDIGKWLYNNRATIMSWGATAGTIGGGILSARAMPKAIKRLDEALARKKAETECRMTEEMYDHDDISEAVEKTELTVWEKIKAAGPSFIPTVLVEAATIGCIHGSNIANKQEIRKTSEVLALTVAAFSAYSESVGQLTDRTTEFAAAKRVEKMTESEMNGDPPWTDKQWFAFSNRPLYFERTMEEVFEAEYQANRIFALKNDLTLNELYEVFGLPPVTDELEYENDGDCMGWNDYLGEVYYGYHWIDFVHRPPNLLPDGRLVTVIELPFGPHPLDEDVINEVIDAKTGTINRLMDIMDVRLEERAVSRMADN